MAFKISKEIKLALLGILSILVFVFGYKYLKGTGIFSSSKTIFAEYDNVQGLTPASYVQLKGFTVGSVNAIELSKEHRGKVKLTLFIEKELNIPIDSKATIVSLDLLGTKAVNIEMGVSNTMLKDNEMITGTIELGTIESLGASATPVMENAKITLASLETTVQSINNILDVNTQNNLKSSIANLNNTMKDFSQFANELNTQRTKISGLLDNLNAFSVNLNKNNNTINNVLKNTEITTSNLSKLNLEATVNELKATLGDLQTTLKKVNNGNGSLALLMNDDKLYKNLKNTLETTNNLMYDINAHPSKYININIIGRKQKNESAPISAPNSSN
jgi:phospholipid/cholesterol/gamma-HCH transport system substrate-binding protein